MQGSSKLSAINVMLSVIGESSTNTLTGTLPFEISLAESILDETIRETLQDSFVFNTEYDVSITPDVNNHCVAQTSWIRIQDSDSAKEYVLREYPADSGTFILYDMQDKTDEFSSALEIDIVYLLDFIDLPEAAKRYCTIRAARIYADRLVGSKDIRAYTQQDEIEAKAKLMSYEVNVDRLNMLKDSAFARNLVNRRI